MDFRAKFHNAGFRCGDGDGWKKCKESKVLMIVIRHAAENDLEGILKLYGTLEENKDCGIDIDAAVFIFSKIYSYPDYSIYVAEIEGNIVGTFSLAIMDNVAHRGAPSGLVEDVIVAENYQRMGIGKRMMTAAMEICKQKGCYKMALSSNVKRKDAHKFYESLGFKIHGYSFLVEL
ncbi:GNAT family N-acetyltransferase [Desulfitobacterium dehalogenans]|uniref:GNAT family N-acetyltransferase n=1 Tax=Desulfitobacterium dehalogenans TaxID=36854 RepID=UPI0011D27E2E|nr:GNAT family N-acetyltransferase [Desulfitobacterium dehalogenans]